MSSVRKRLIVYECASIVVDLHYEYALPPAQTSGHPLHRSSAHVGQ